MLRRSFNAGLTSNVCGSSCLWGAQRLGLGRHLSQSSAQSFDAVVIGGGVVGTSVLYHLTKEGWHNVALLERKVLTAGSTWHAAGGFHTLNSDPTVSALQAYTIRLYKEIEEYSGHSCGVHMTGGINTASSPERWAYLRNEWAKHRTMGINSELLTPEQIVERNPLVNPEGLLGGLWDENEGHLDCSGVTWAFAKSARKNGATIHQHTKVEKLEQRSDGSWDVHTDSQGVIHAQHIVNAAGLWAREVGEMVGIYLPLLPMSHHYIVTDAIPELEGHPTELPMTIDLDGESYMRQEGKGCLLGVYEQDCRPWAADGSPWEYAENDLLPPELERVAPQMEKGFRRYPALQSAGLKTVVNGPFTFAPDGNPLVGPVHGTDLRGPRNYWVACAVMAGFAQGGGVGLTLAEWMAHGSPKSYPDAFAMDVSRFGRWATRAYTLRKAQENYTRRFRIA